MMIKKNDDTIEVRLAKTCECSQIAALYSKVAITRENYRDALKSEMGTFGTKGGMFDPISAASVQQELEKGESWLVASINGNLCGSLWFDVANLQTFSTLTIDLNYRTLYQDLPIWISEGKVCYAKDIISIEPKESYPLFYSMLKQCLQQGMLYVIGEVYYVDSYIDADGYHPVQLINGASCRFLERVFADFIGTLAQKTVVKDAFDALITPRVFLVSIPKAMQIIEKELEKHGYC